MRTNYSLSPEQRADARAALTILAGSGLSLQAAAEAALSGRVQPVRTVTVDQAGALFLTAKAAAKRRPKTLSWYSEMLDVFAGKFGGEHMDGITRAQLLAWIAERPAGSRPHFIRVVRALFRWAGAQEPPLLGVDPTVGMRAESTESERAIAFLLPEQAGALLRSAGRHRAAFALALFAGLRPEEIAGEGKPWIRWESINEIEQSIRVPAECAKTKRARFIEGLPPALWEWLASVPVAERADTVAVAQSQRACRVARRILGLDRWPQDVLRHTFATYAVALTGDPSRVSLWLGHEGSVGLLHRHYRGLATRAQADAFFGLRP